MVVARCQETFADSMIEWTGKSAEPFDILTKLSNLLINWITPMIWPNEFLMAIQSIVRCLKLEPSSTLWSNRWSSYALAMVTVYIREKKRKIVKLLMLNVKTLNCCHFYQYLTSPHMATWPVMPMLMGNLDSNGLVRVLLSSSLTSFASKSNTLEKLPLDASCTNKI